MTDSLSQLLGLQDISQFQNSAAQGNVLLNLSPAVYGAKFDRSTWSPTESFATSFLQGVLGTALNQIGRQQVADQVSAVSKVLPALYRDPSSVEVPEGVDESAFSILRNSAATSKIARELQREQTAQSLIQELFKEKALTKMKADAEVENAGPIAKAKKEGELSAFDSVFGGKSSTSNPDDPRYKAEQDLIKIERDYTDKLLTGVEARSALNINKAASNIFEALKQNNPLAASTAIFEFAKLQDPAGVVREQDEMRVSDPGGPLGRLAQLHNQIIGEGKLTPEAKSAMRQIIPFMVKNQFSQYDQLKQGYLDAAKEYGANPSRIKFISPVDLSGYANDEEAPLSNITAALTQIRDALAMPNITTEERNALVERARQIRGRINGGS